MDDSVIRSFQGKHASYNVQSIVDEQQELLVHEETINVTCKTNQFADLIDKTNAILEPEC